MEEYFARQRRRRLIVLAAVLAAALVIFLVVMFAKFRAHSNYRFQSISDFFYQTIIGSEKLEYEFVDQNVSETQIGPYTIRTMSIRLGEETKLVQAVAVPSLFGTYYLFPSLHAATRIGDRQTLSGSEMTYYTQIMLMPLKGGALLHIVSNQEYTEYKGDWNMQSIETYGEDYNPRAPEAKGCQYFWLPNSEMPEEYTLMGQGSQTDFTLGLADMGYPKY